VTKGHKIFIALLAVAFVALLILPIANRAPAGPEAPDNAKEQQPDPYFSESAIQERRDRARGYWAGMTAQQALAELGTPKSRTAYGSATGETEQWFYEKSPEGGRLFLYFEDGRLTRWQADRPW
jgi:hypothetical protein